MLEPRPLDPESNALAIRPPHLPKAEDVEQLKKNYNLHTIFLYDTNTDVGAAQRALQNANRTMFYRGP